MNPDTSAVFERFAALRQRYPDDVKRIEADERAVQELLQLSELAQHPHTQRLLQHCREEIVSARRRLATDRDLLNDPQAQLELWAIIDARMWLVQMLSVNVDMEVAKIQMMVEQELQP